MQIYRKFLALIPPRWRPVPVIIGGLLVHITLGTLYTIGNMNPYIASYFRRYDSDTVSYNQMAWFSSLMICGQASTLMIGGWLDQKFGPRIATAIGCSISSVGVIISYFTIKTSFWPFILTYALWFGLGLGIAYTPPLACSMKWFPNRRGFASGIIVCGFGSGAFIFNQVQTKYINPNNLEANVTIGADKYFDQPEVLDKVPSMILILGFTYLGIQMIGCLLLENPDPATMPEFYENNSKLQKSLKENDSSLSPIQALKSPTFWLLWFAFIFGGQGTVMLPTYYKSFGLTFISDDYFLALVGSFSSIFNAAGRIFWGHMADKFSFQSVITTLCGFYAFLMLTYPATVKAGKVMYFIWTCAAFGTFGGQYSLYPMAIAKAFGQTHFGVIYGFLFTCQIVGSLSGALLASKLKDLIDYNGIWFYLAGCLMISFLINALLTKTKHGRVRQSIVETRNDVQG